MGSSRRRNSEMKPGRREVLSTDVNVATTIQMWVSKRCVFIPRDNGLPPVLISTGLGNWYICQSGSSYRFHRHHRFHRRPFLVLLIPFSLYMYLFSSSLSHTRLAPLPLPHLSNEFITYS